MRIVAQNYVGYFIDDIPVPFSRMKWMDLAGKPYIWHVVERLKRCKRIDEIILQAQDTPENKETITLAKEWNLNLRYFGRPHNWETQLKWFDSLNADIAIYTNVSPLIDSKTVDSMIDYFIEKDLDYLRCEEILLIHMSKTSIWPRLYELEKDFSKIKGSWPNLVQERSDLFKSETFGKLDEIKFLGQNSLRWYSPLRKIYNKFYKHSEIIKLDEVLSFYEQEPEWFEVIAQDQLEIEATNDCDLKCVMCPRTSNMNRETGYMDFGLFKKIIDETEALGVHFSGFGEPLLHPQIKDMFAYAKERGLEVGLWSNGLNLDEDLYKGDYRERTAGLYHLWS